MKVDMSPEAVKARMQQMDQLWELSVKLMNNKPGRECRRLDGIANEFERPKGETERDAQK